MGQMRKVAEAFSIKKIGSDTYIEGYANRAVVDRGGDIIQKDAWNLENYLKVPIILFNHDKDNPIGKAMEIQATDGGLWIKAKISNSQNPEISRVRDLINEGILNAFSVGFDSDPQAEEKLQDGTNSLRRCELYEVSVVTMPMNQDSVFNLSSKDLSHLSLHDAIVKALNAKGARLASIVVRRIHELEGKGYARAALLDGIRKASGASNLDLQSLMAGHLAGVSDSVLGAISNVLGIEIQTLKDANYEGEPEMKAKADVNAMEIVALKIPKEQAQSPDEAAKLATDAGYQAAKVTDEGDYYLILQSDNAQIDPQCQEVELGDGASAIVRLAPLSLENNPSAETPTEPEMPGEQMAAKPPVPPMAPKPQAQPSKPTAPAAKPQAPAPAQAPAAPAPESTPPSPSVPSGLSDAELAKLKAEFEAELQAVKEHTPGKNPPNWVADETAWAKAEDAASKTYDRGTDTFYAVTVWLYLNRFGGTKKSKSWGHFSEKQDGPSMGAPTVGGGSATIPIDDNPYLEQARQTNILLGVLIEEFRSLSACLQGSADAAAQQQGEPVESVVVQDELQKSLAKNLELYRVDLERRLKKLGA